ncbi:MAG: zf-HC2 domain-containing protein [Bacteroidales bacterium]|nr:zf-HC2 domain-containing protein [Bacteroidales bacterium]
MKCKKAHRLIALHRDGELDVKIQQRLRDHLAKCESCSRLYRAYRQNDRIAAQIRFQLIAPDNAENLTDRILNTIAQFEGKHAEISITNRWDMLINLLFLPVTRRIIIAFTVLLIATFSYQQFYIFSRITTMEKQLAAAGKSGLMTAESKDMKDCLQRSARYLSKIKAGQGEMNINLQQYFTKNPEKLNLYMSLLCNRQYGSLEKLVTRDNHSLQDLIITYKMENK